MPKVNAPIGRLKFWGWPEAYSSFRRGEDELSDFSDIKKKIDDIAVFNDIVPALLHIFSNFSNLLLASQSNQVLIFHHLCADEPAFKVRMNDTCRLGGKGSLSGLSRPVPHPVQQ